MTDDIQLLERFAARGDEDAFRELIGRHLDLVYSAALRRVNGDATLAQDVAQTVFTDLARKARSLPRDVLLTAWLYEAARFAAANAIREERRWQAREQEALTMQQLASESTPGWEQLGPVLDDAMGELSAPDRNAILLRYFQNQDFQAVGLALGVSDDTAQKRVSRAVERLRELLARRGIKAGASGLVVLISANGVLTAPAGLSAAIAATALAGTTLITATTATVGKAIAMTTTQKVLIVAALAVAVGTGMYVAHDASTLRNQLQSAAPLAEQILQLTGERDDALNKLATLRDGNDLASSGADRSELMRLRAEVTRLQNERADLQRLRSDAAVRASTNTDPKLAFQHRFLSRSTWANAGLGSPAQSLETFLWAWTSKNEAATLQASALDTNGQPIRLTGMSTDYQDRLKGLQILSFGSPTTNPDDMTATMVTEVTNQMADQNGRLYEGTNHGVLRLRFKRSDGEWRFVGRF